MWINLKIIVLCKSQTKRIHAKSILPFIEIKLENENQKMKTNLKQEKINLKQEKINLKQEKTGP